MNKTDKEGSAWDFLIFIALIVIVIGALVILAAGELLPQLSH